MQHTNSLIHSTSPYLLQHAHNPVNWFAWGDEALQKAKQENKPILLSIGYSSCHWCHVMERESFENEQTAAVMNEYFINIKVDREERPDLDHIYMNAIQTLTGSGGWPLNVFLTPDLKPFYGGTYFPPKPLHNRPSWNDVLMYMADAFKNKRDEVEQQANQLLEIVSKNIAFKKSENLIKSDSLFSSEDFEKMFIQMELRMDKQNGGFERAPKFLGTMNMEWLLTHNYFTKSEVALQHVEYTLKRMSNGGIYDVVGGGIARYSTDAEWFAPHFEKMLYDNALFLNSLSQTYSITQNSSLQATAEQTIQYIKEEMLDGNGGFYSALDADSEGVEGKYYCWEEEDLKSNLNESEFELIKNHCSVLPEGNWEHGFNILHATHSANDKLLWDSVMKKLKAVRQNKIKPQLDDKQLLSWNALLIGALAKAVVVFKDSETKQLALNGIKFIEEKLCISFPKFYHQCTKQNAAHTAYLDDYAYLMQAYLDVYAINFDENYLKKAYQIATFIIENFNNENSPFFYFTSKEQVDVVARTTEVYDGAQPSANSVICRCFIKLSYIFDDIELMEIAEQQLTEIKSGMHQHPTSFANWAIAAYEYTNGLTEIICTGNDAANFASEIQTQFIPCKMIFVSNKNTSIEKLKDYFSEENKIYVCKNKSCLAPVNSVAEALKNI
ncbi:MAG: hypothetical protein RIQ33_1069 [Bacteroidota bacterium]|jgi:uncharacterized protein YyaL (SSP411 family)